MKYILGIIIILAVLNIQADFDDLLIKEEQLQTGKEIFEKLKSSIGDISHLETIHTNGITIQQLPAGQLSLPVEVVVQFPDKLYLKIQDKEYSIQHNKGWIKHEKGYYESLSETDLNRLISNLHKNLIYLLKYSNEYEILFQRYESEEDKDIAVLQLIGADIDLELFIDLESYLPVKIQHSSLIGDSVRSQTRFYREFRTVDNIKIPVHTQTYDEQGELIIENRIDTIKLNNPVDPDLF